MYIYNVLYWVFFIIAIAGGVFILISRNILYAAYLLMVVFLSLAGIYILAKAEFVAVTQVLVYVGGILILLIFGIMLTNRVTGSKILTKRGNTFLGGLVTITVFLVLYVVIIQSVGWNDFFLNKISGEENTQKIGIQLLTKKVLILEISGVLLLIALIGSAFLARRELVIED